MGKDVAMINGRWSMVDDRWSMVGKGMGKSIGNFFCSILSCLFFLFFLVLVFYFFFCFIKHGGACLFFLFFLVLFFLFFCFIIFFNIVLTWKFVEASKASVLYIYIDI